MLPLLYVLRTHHRTGKTGWTFLFIFILLQCTGSGMIVGAGQNGTPSATAIIIVQVGVSPLLLGLAGVVHEYAKLSGLMTTRRAQTTATIVDVAYHLAVIAAIAVYAVGASGSFKQPPPENAQTLYEAGVILVLALFLALCMTFAVLVWKTRSVRIARALVWPIAISLVLMLIRIIYSSVAAFNQNDPAFNPVTGRIVYQIVLIFLPGALIVAAMVTGGVMTTDVEAFDRRGMSSAPLPLAASQRKVGDCNA